ncbi:ISL3 family transposase [Solihabitans fulvus]|uniref:ISL3 family transposase n=1 Tax=Solihabitans fulvus TaxID=1892852 RepID=UPI001CB75FFF|nr:ISL3 family transposase [Solihabitans fulvus]
MLTVLGMKIVQVVTDDPDAARCPSCQVCSTSGKDWVLTRPRDLPCGGEFLVVQWRKRRWRCRTEDCPRGSFTEQVAQVPAGMRTTTRLRAALAVAVEDGRDQSEVAAAHRVSWPTVQRAVVARGAAELVEPEPVRVLGMDETRFGRPRWLPDGVHADGRIRWVRTDPWETGFVDITGEQSLLGQVDGRTSAAVQAWLAARSPEFRAGIEVVVIDPHAGYAAAVRAALPDAAIAVDHFHLIMLANKAVTAVRQRVTRDLLGRRGRKIDPAWANRRLLLRGRERLSQAALARMWNGCVDHDPSGQILSAWIAKEELRALCATAARGGHPGEIRDRLYAFYQWSADAQIPELTTLAETIETWWPAIEVFLATGLTNARTEGTNRLIKQVKRAACGFRNRENYRRRVRLHCTRRIRRLSARNPTVPA